MEKSLENTQALESYIEYSNDGNEEEEEGRSSESEQGSWDFPIRSRQRFLREQLKILENLYSSTKRPSFEEKDKLANKFGTSIKRIQIWFQNRRAKDKKLLTTSSDGSQKAVTDVSSSCFASASATTTTAATSSLSPRTNFRSTEKRSKRKGSGPSIHPSVPVPVPRRRIMVPERHQVAFPGNKPVPDTGDYYQPFYTHNMWYQGYRFNNPHHFNQSPPGNDQQLNYSRVTRSQSKKRKP